MLIFAAALFYTGDFLHEPEESGIGSHRVIGRDTAGVILQLPNPERTVRQRRRYG